jgi:hypothetical protein
VNADSRRHVALGSDALRVPPQRSIEPADRTMREKSGIHDAEDPVASDAASSFLEWLGFIRTAER